MATRSDRIEARLEPQQRDRITAAAAVAARSVSSFMVGAALEKADAVLADQRTTTVPDEYFDQLLDALDDDTVIEALRPAAQRTQADRRFTRR